MQVKPEINKKGRLVKTIIGVSIALVLLVIASLITHFWKAKKAYEDSIDMVIALINDYNVAFRFVVYGGNGLEVSYGYMSEYYSWFNPIDSMDFVDKTLVKGVKVTIPQDDYMNILSLGRAILEEKPGDRKGSTGVPNLAILTNSEIYEMNTYLWPSEPEITAFDKELLELLAELSPLTVYIGKRREVHLKDWALHSKQPIKHPSIE
jgi:hypothetical protein